MELGILVPLDNDVILFWLAPSSRWGGNEGAYDKYNESTHQFIADRAYEYARMHYSHVFDPVPVNKLNHSANKNIDWANLVWFANWPDDYWNESDVEFFIPTRKSHVYMPWNGENLYYNESSKTAKSRFIGHYNEAVDYYLGINGKAKNKAKSFNSLGCALHYAGDLATPVHTSYQVADCWSVGNSNHTWFENKVLEKEANGLRRQENLLVGYTGNADWWTWSLSAMADQAAWDSHGQYYDSYSSLSTSLLNNAIQLTLQNAVNFSAAVLKKFAEQVLPASGLSSTNLFNINGNVNTNFDLTAVTANSVSSSGVLKTSTNGSQSHAAGQLIDVIPGATYTLSFNSVSNGNGTGSYIVIYWFPGISVLRGYSLYSTSGYKSYTFSPPNSPILVTFSTSGGTDAQYSNISLIRNTNHFDIDRTVNTYFDLTTGSSNTVTNGILITDTNGATSHGRGQLVDVVPGATYTLSYNVGNHGTGSSSVIAIYWTPGSSTVGAVNYSGTGSQSYSFVAQSGRILLTFSSFYGTGSQYSNIQLTSPTTGTLTTIP
ncbi:MAG: hypothetical protein FWD58_03930 [Firmicutes bacterium]|nr:hypothetical protein [Bacillota bacterium]